MIAQHRTGANVDDHEQPHPLDLKFVLKAKRITYDYFETDIEAVPVEFHHLIWARCRRRRHPAIALRQAFQVRRASRMRRDAEAAQHLGLYAYGE